MKKMILLIATSLLLLSCEKDSADLPQTQAFNAKVLRKGLDCGNVYLIKFNNDTPGVPANSFDNVFYALNLPANLQVENLDVQLAFRSPNPDEIIACGTMDITYPQIVIENAN